MKAGLFGDIAECAVAIIPVETVGSVGRVGSTVQPGAAKNQNIHPAIVVIVQECRAAAHGFQDVGLVVGLAVDHRGAQTGGLADVGESGVERQT